MAIRTSDLLERAGLEQKELETKVAELEKTLPELQAENARLKDELKKFELFRDLVDNPPKYWSVTIKDAVVVAQLNVRARKLFGKLGSTEASEKEAMRNIDTLIEACLRYCVSNTSRWNDMVSNEKLVMDYRANGSS